MIELDGIELRKIPGTEVMNVLKISGKDFDDQAFQADFDIQLTAFILGFVRTWRRE